MPTATLTKRAANTLLVDAQQQHEALARQFSELQGRLTRTEPGTEAFTVLAHKAADLKAQLQQLTDKIQGLEQQATTDAERKAAAERQAAAEAAQAAAEAQGERDLAKVNGLVDRINAASDELVAALTEYDGLTAQRQRLTALGWVIFDSQNRSTRVLTEGIPFVMRHGKIARLVKRSEIPPTGRR